MVDLNGCLRGDQAAWDGFVRFAGPVLYAAVARALRRHGIEDASTAEDVTQDVFVRLVKDGLRLLRTFDASRASLPTWLTLLGRSGAIDHVRRRRLPTVETDADSVPVSPEPAIADTPTESLDLPPDLLSPRERLVLSLLYDHDLSVAEAAETLAVEEQTIRSLRHKAVAKIRERLAGGGGLRRGP